MQTRPLAALTAAGIAAGLVFAACGGGTGKAGTPCTTDTDCGTGFICHPLAKLCAKTCTAGADCPSTAKNCAPWTGPNDAGTGATSICQCATGQLCGGGTGSTTICGTEDKICETKCGSNADCAGGRSCDVDGGTGQCRTAPAGCNPACTGGQVCDTTSNTCVAACTVGSCTAGVCNYTTGICVTASSCSSGNPQPDTCVGGELCSGSSCADVAPPSCANFTSSAHANTWAPGSAAPVIYATSTDSFGTNATICSTAGTTTLAKIHVQAYWLGGKFPTSGDANTGGYIGGALHYVKQDGSEGTATVSTTALNVTNGATVSEADFHMLFCLPDAQTTFTGGLHFYVQPGADLSAAATRADATCTGGTCISGNEACFTAP